MTKKVFLVLALLAFMLISFSLVLATKRTVLRGTPERFVKQTLANKQLATRMPKATLTQKQTATSVYPVGRAKPPATSIPLSAPQTCRLQHDNGNGVSYFSGWSAGDQQAVYYDPATMCTECDTVYPLEVTQIEGVFYDHAGAGDLDVIFHFYEAGDVCTGPGVEIYSFETTITTFYPDVAVVSVPDLLCLEDDFFLACEYNSGIAGEIPSLLADDSPPVDTCFQWNEYQDLGWIEWWDFWSPPHPGWLMLRAVGTCDAEDCYEGEECNMMQGSGAPASYFDSWNVEDGVAKYYDPEEYCTPPVYPYKISEVKVALYNFAGVESSDVRIAIYLGGSDPCDGLGIEIYRTDSITVTEFYPSVTQINLPDVVCLYEPFFVAVEYASGITGEIPSVLMDDGSVPMDTCHAYVWLGDPSLTFTWSEFWAPPIPGVPMIWVEGYTESPLCSGEILPGQGLRFYQLDLTYPGATQLNSRYGLAVADFDSLLAATGIGMGYLNIVTPQGWVVRNMPVDTSSGYPGLSTMFDLGDTVDIDSLLVYAHISEDPSLDFSAIPNVIFDVGTRENNAQGSDSPRPAPPRNPVDVTVVEFELGGLTDAVWQPGHPNVEQDVNQCAPGAVANSLKWLDDKYEGITVPHEHRPGIRDNSLPGELDQDMERAAHEPVTSAKNFLRGKLEYIDDNEGLKGKFDIKHKSRPGITWLPDDETVGGTTSEVDTTDTSLVEWLINELKAGEDVEVRIGWHGGGGHYIDLIGGGHVLGAPWIAWVHDADQGYDGDNVDENGGVNHDDGGIGFSWIDGDTIIVYIEGDSLPGTIDYAVSESPKPPTWMYHPRFVNGTLTVYGTIDCQTVGDPLFEGYVLECHEYSGLVPEWCNDYLAIFEWDYWCGNVDSTKVAVPSYDGGRWRLLDLAASLLERLVSGIPVLLPTVGDSSGIFQRVHLVIDTSRPEWFTTPPPLQDTYDIIDGECEDLPGYLIGTTPIVFDSLAGPDENPFQTTPLTGTLVRNGEIVFAPDTKGCCQFPTRCEIITEAACTEAGGDWQGSWLWACIDDKCEWMGIDCPSEGIPEDEPVCDDDWEDVWNGGCNSTPYVFQDIACDAIICGTSGIYLYYGENSRDTDWFRLEVTEEATITWSAVAAFPVSISVMDAGSENCVDYIILDSASAEIGDTAALSLDVPAGTYWLSVAPSAFEGYRCGLEYVAEVTCGTPQAGICGDCNGDSIVDVGDVIYLIGYLFVGASAPDPLCIGDVDCNADVDNGDLIYLINYLFLGTSPPCAECCDVKATTKEFPTHEIERAFPQKKEKLPGQTIERSILQNKLVPQELPRELRELRRTE